MESKIVIPMKIKLLTTFIIIFLIVGTPLCLIGYYKYNVYALNKETYDYLYTKGYKENEIKKVEVINVKGPLLSTLVEFEDEPNVLYWYDKKDGEIVQIGIYKPNVADVTKFRHSE